MGWLSIFVPVSIIGWMVIYTVRRAFQMKALAHGGVVIEGRVIKKFRQTGSTPRHPYLRYDYITPTGQRYEHKIAVSEEVWETYEVGDPIEIVYVPNRPSVSAAKYMVNLSRQALKMSPL